MQRTGFELARAADRAGLVTEAWQRVLLVAAFLLPLLAAVTFLATVARRSRWVGAASCTSAAIGPASAVVVLRYSGGQQLGPGGSRFSRRSLPAGSACHPRARQRGLGRPGHGVRARGRVLGERRRRGRHVLRRRKHRDGSARRPAAAILRGRRPRRPARRVHVRDVRRDLRQGSSRRSSRSRASSRPWGSPRCGPTAAGTSAPHGPRSTAGPDGPEPCSPLGSLQPYRWRASTSRRPRPRSTDSHSHASVRMMAGCRR